MEEIQKYTEEELDELLDEAFEHLKQGRYRMALTNAKKVFDEKPNDCKAATCYAWAILENGNPVQALELANLAIELKPDDVNTRLYRGYFLMRMGVYEGALSDIDYAISNKTDLLTWAYLNKARTLAGLERYFEALEIIDKAIEYSSEPNEKLIKIKDYLRTALGYNEGFFSGILTRKKSHLEEGEEALKEKEFWFALWAARDVLKSPSLSKYHDEAHLLELEALLGLYQYKTIKGLIEIYKHRFSDNQRFKSIERRVFKFYNDNKSYVKNESDDFVSSNRTDLKIYEKTFFNVIHAKTYDVIESNRTGKRTYLLQFNDSLVRYIGIEVLIDNPFYNNKDAELEGLAVWSLNGVEVGRHSFKLNIKKQWQYLEFVQSWGTDTPGFWCRGQGKVDIYLSNILICTRFFLIGDSEIVNFEEDKLRLDENSLEKPSTNQPISAQKYSQPESQTESLEELLLNLNSFIGLNEIKQSLNDFVDYLKFINERKKLGLKTQGSLSVHSVFLGNPGTGKTTIARLLGKIFRAMGIVENGHVIEVDRSGLVGQYIGETAQKTQKVIEEAIGGVLFIDEAYSLIKEGNQQDFGKEAIDVLLKKMEDTDENFVVIVAGYPEEMESFLNSNPGLKSRFSHTFNFPDYTPEELIEIFKKFASDEEYSIEDDAIEYLKSVLTELYRKRDKTFGNARLVRNYFNDVKIQIGKRYLKLPEDKRTKEAMTTITKEDIENIINKNKTDSVQFDIDEEKLNNLLDELNNFVGLNSVKKEIADLVKLARFYIEQGEKLTDKFFSHFVFVGNPGTGKTTVARLFSQINSALGILPKGHLVETDRRGLVGTYVGQTAEKTNQLINEAIGGTLFIDEAYALYKPGDTGSDFGQEAIDTLLKRMEDDRGKFIVIAAGYTDEMKIFLNSNPGLKSRFTKTLVFEDYSPDELLTITETMLNNKNYLLAEEVKKPLLNYYTELYKNRDKSFGNARVVRNLIEASLKNHLLRIADVSPSNRNKEIIELITLDDFSELISPVKKTKEIQVQTNKDLLEIYLEELNKLAGLEDVKKSVDKLISSLKVSKLRKERGLKVVPKNLHSVFLGNPGTGKTTVARLLSKIYKEMGVLSRGHLMEVDRSMLVAGYQGQTAVKTAAVIEKAVGGTLFIDEAYSLAKPGDDFGREAIETLLKRMEDYQGDLVVIVAGYTDEMKAFLDSNPGLSSRFTNFFYFEDFTPRQLLEIALVISTDSGYQLDEGAWQLLLDIFTDLYKNRSKNYGNARTVKNILFKAISNQEERISTLPKLTDQDLITITFDDIKNIDVSTIS